MNKNKSFKSQLTVATSKFRLNEGTEKHVENSAILYVSVALAIFFTPLSTSEKMKKFDRSGTQVWYNYTAVCFGFAMFFGWLTFATAKSAEKRALSRILLMVNSMAFCTYIFTIWRLIPVWRGFHGYPVEISRFMEWSCTCPSLILIIGEITKQYEIAKQTMHFDYILLFTGFLAFITKDPFSHYFALASLSAFYCLLVRFNQMFVAALDSASGCRLDTITLQAARTVTLVAWTMFPLTFFLLKAKLITYLQSEMMFCLSDILAKVVLTMILINASVEQSQNEKVDDLSAIAENMEMEISNSDSLLQRMMPKEIFEQFKQGKVPGTEEYECATIFFSDIANFTVLSSLTSTKDMLATLTNMWKEYDKLAVKWGMYKVETIGDAYVGVIGCPDRKIDHAEKSVEFAFAIIDMIKNFKTVMNTSIQIRIGIASGKITAGVLGKMNPHWCVVGEPVQMANKMESTSRPMQIHINEETYELLKGNLKYQFDGPQAVSFKGRQISSFFITKKG